MKRTMIKVYVEVTCIAPDDSVVSHWKGYQTIPKPLPWDKPVFEAFKAAIFAGDNLHDIAKRFDVDWWSAMIWKCKLTSGRWHHES